MITLSVTSFNGAPASPGPTAVFDELGGTIGRADTNQLVLPDPERAISRVHAQVVFRNGEFAIVDRGSNPILVNGRPVGSGREQAIREGDQVQIGGYVLAVKRPAAVTARTDDPFADLLGPAASARASAGPAGGSPGLVDPLAAFGVAPTPQTHPGIYQRASAPPPAAAPAGLGGIPDDWDPFAPASQASPGLPGARPPASMDPLGQFGLDGGAAAPAPLVGGLPASGGGGADSLDALFGLKPGQGGDPLANSALDAPMAKPNMAASADPMQSLNSAPLASNAALPDDFSDLQRPFSAPPAVDSRPPAPAPVSAPVAPVLPAAEPVVAAPAPAVPAGAVLSWDTPGGDGRTVIRPAARAPEPAPVQPSPSLAAAYAAPGPNTEAFARISEAPPAPLQALPAGFGEVPAMAAVAAVAAPLANGSVSSAGYPPAANAVPVGAASSAHAADTQALLAALREGLAVPGLQLDALTPDVMRLIGQLLHESARGTVDLLVARAALKREVRAEATMIVARENNPMKFSPSAEAALQHLLAPPVRGFMEAAPAMRDAFDDLRAHQFGFIAGMRAALAGVLARFDPAELEGRLTQRSVLSSLLPGSRKAAMWDVFTEHFAQISAEAEDDFHSLFGKAFLKAYEEHIEQLHKDRP